jgi:hypothetical protein
MLAQKFLERAPREQLQRFLKLMHSKQEQAQTRRQSPDIKFSIQ